MELGSHMSILTSCRDDHVFDHSVCVMVDEDVKV
jgi:hypothetical protein